MNQYDIEHFFFHPCPSVQAHQNQAGNDEAGGAGLGQQHAPTKTLADQEGLSRVIAEAPRKMMTV